VGAAQDALPVSGHADYADILEWRRQRGLAAQPDIAILSSSLDIPLEPLEPYRQRRLMVITGGQAERKQVDRLTAHGIEVITAGTGRAAEGGKMITALGGMGYHSIYAIAGPAVCHTLLAARVLDRLYLTITHQLLSGDAFDTFTRGEPLVPAQGMRLISLYQDLHAPPGASQWFATFEPG